MINSLLSTQLLSLLLYQENVTNKSSMICVKSEKYAFPVFILITHQDINSKLFSVYKNLGKQKSPRGMPRGLFCFPIVDF